MQGFVEGESADVFSPNSHLLQETTIKYFLGWYAKDFPCNHQLILATFCKSEPLFSIPWMAHPIWSHQVSYLYPSIKCSILSCIQSSTFILSYFRFNLENLTNRETQCILYIVYTELRKPLMVPHLFVGDLREKSRPALGIWRYQIFIFD